MAEATKLESVPTIREVSPSSKAIDNLQSFQEYYVIEQLPSMGAESDVYIVQKNNTKYILKLYRLGIKPKEEILDKLEALSHKYPKDLVKIYKTGLDENTKRWFEIQEYINNGSLKEFKNEINTETLYEIIEEILALLHTLHTNKIIHRDIKPENILIRSYKPLDLVITDFGISSLLDDSTNIWTKEEGTYKYFAPESFTGVIGIAVDYWSLGMIIYELANNKKHYFHAIKNHTIHHHITTRNIEIPTSFDENIQQLLGFLFRRNPENRGNYKLVNKWLKGEDIGKPKPDEKAIEEKNGYPFDGKKYNNFKSLAKTVSSSYKNWTLWGKHLENGSALAWAKEHQQYDKKTLLESIAHEDNNFMVFKFIYTFNNEIKEFKLFGKIITINNLHLFTQNYFNNKFKDEEKKIYEYLISSKMKIFYNEYLKLTQTEDKYSKIFDEITLYIRENGEDGLSKRVILKFLNFLNHQDEYVLPNQQKDINIKTFNYFIKTKELEEHSQLSTLPIEVLKNMTLKEFKDFRKLIKMKIKEYYYPNDFFNNLNKDFKKTIQQINFFIKKNQLYDIEKRYYIPSNSSYSSYITIIKDSPYAVYIPTYKKLKSLKKDVLILKTQLEEAKQHKELFELNGINIEKPYIHEFSKIKKILNSHMNLKTYQTIKEIPTNKVHKYFSSYLSKVENFNIKINNDDDDIINYIKNYRWKVNLSKIIFILFLISILSIIPLYITKFITFYFLITFMLLFPFIFILYSYFLNELTRIPHRLISRISRLIEAEGKDKKNLHQELLYSNNILFKIIYWVYTLLASSLVIYYEVLPMMQKIIGDNL